MEPNQNRCPEGVPALRALWERLGQAIEQTCSSIVRMDLAAVNRDILRQEELCSKIRALEGRLRNEGTVIASNDALLQRAAGQVRRSNRLQSELLRRSGHLLTLRLNTLANSFATYPPPHLGRS